MKSRQNWLPVAMVAASLVGGGLVTVGLGYSRTEAPRVVTAQEFRLVDQHGKTRIVLDMQEGRPSIRLLDAEGTPRVSLYGSSDQNPEELEAQAAGMNILSRDGKTAVRLGLEYIWPSLKMHYQGGDYLVAICVDNEGLPQIALREKDNKSEDTPRFVYIAPGHGEGQ